MTEIAHFIALESQVWNALTTGDAKADQALLAADFLGVYGSGFSDRAGHVDQLAQGPTICRYTISEARILELGHDHVLLAYRADYTRMNSNVDEAMYISSIWENRDGRWVNSFSQDSHVTENIL